MSDAMQALKKILGYFLVAVAFLVPLKVCVQQTDAGWLVTIVAACYLNSHAAVHDAFHSQYRYRSTAHPYMKHFSAICMPFLKHLHQVESSQSASEFRLPV